MTAATADRHLLFGLLALQNGLINQGQLVAAFQAWTLDKSKSLADHLEARGELSSATRALLEGLAAVHLEAHGGDVGKSLAAVSAGKSTQESLARIGDPEIQATLGHVASANVSIDHGDVDGTVTYGVGTATSDGQRFRVLRPHARGGLGAVFVALDAELNREVALKQILDQHADDPVSRQRFLIEAEITGGLEHPGIVPVYGLGTYDGGRPYYAMRFIKGDSLKEAIERFHGDPALKASAGRRSLELRKLLHRFTDVCNAIDYAHSRGVLHRDIKPGNIIVGKYGETLVVDWGLAKPLGHVDPGQQSGERTLMPSSTSGSSETLPGSALGTPAYMSPEQACGDLDRLGPRSDVYSLGATLYCSLTGRPPFEGEDIGELLRKVQRGEFARPRQLDPSIDQALEAVCLKAMARQPEDRYASCRALADDVERWAADEPVAGWAEPWARTLLRWLTRHRTGVTGAAAAVLAGVVGLAAVLGVQASANTRLSASLARETRANAELTRSKGAVQARYDLAVEAIKTFHTGVSEDFLLKEPQFKALRDGLLKSALDFYGKLSALLGKESDRAARRALAQANYEVANLIDRVGHKEDALAAHRAVLAAREALAAEPGTDVETKADVGGSLATVAYLLDDVGRTEEAISMYRQSEALLAKLARATPPDSRVRATLARTRGGLGYVLGEIGATAEALAAHEASLSARRALAEARPDDLRAAVDLAYSLDTFGHLKELMHRSDDALTSYKDGRAVMERVAAAKPGVTLYRDHLAHLIFHIGYTKASLGQTADGLAACYAALAVQQELVTENPAVTSLRNRVASSHHSIGGLLSQSGKPAEALESHRRALAIWQKLVDENPAVTNFRISLASGYESIGFLQSQSGKPGEALESYRRALAIQQKLVDEDRGVTHLQAAVGRGHDRIGTLLSLTGDAAAALEAHRMALAVRQMLADANPHVALYQEELAYSQNSVGGMLLQLGDMAGALAAYGRALTIRQKLAAANPGIVQSQLNLTDTLQRMAWILAQRGKPGESVDYLSRAAAIYHKLALDHPTNSNYRESLATSHADRADVLCTLGRLDDARTGYERAIAIREEQVKANPGTALYRRHLAYSVRRLVLVMMDLAMPADPFAP